MGGAIAVGNFELVAHCSVAGHRQAFGGYCRPGDVAAKTFQLVPFMGPGGNAGMEREPSHLARIDEPTVWPAVWQGLQREHFAPLLWSHRETAVYPARFSPYQLRQFLTGLEPCITRY